MEIFNVIIPFLFCVFICTLLTGAIVAFIVLIIKAIQDAFW